MAAGGAAGLEQPLLESFTPKNHSRLRFAGINVTCLGGTLAELADTIQAAGGQVAAVLTLVNAGRLKPLKPEALVIRRLIDLRLRAKGFQLEAPPAPLSQGLPPGPPLTPT
jgi:hypothetical protein